MAARWSNRFATPDLWCSSMPCPAPHQRNRLNDGITDLLRARPPRRGSAAAGGHLPPGSALTHTRVPMGRPSASAETNWAAVSSFPWWQFGSYRLSPSDAAPAAAAAAAPHPSAFPARFWLPPEHLQREGEGWGGVGRSRREERTEAEQAGEGGGGGQGHRPLAARPDTRCSGRTHPRPPPA